MENLIYLLREAKYCPHLIRIAAIGRLKYIGKIVSVPRLLHMIVCIDLKILSGLWNVLSTFQPVTNITIFTIKCYYAVLYLEHIITVSRKPKENINQTGLATNLLNDNGLNVKFNRFAFFKKKGLLDEIVLSGLLEVVSHIADESTISRFQLLWPSYDSS